MKKVFLPLFIIAISFTFVNAESKNNKSDSELIKEILDSEKKIKKEQKEIDKIESKIKQTRETQKTVNEIKNKLGIDKK